MVTLPHSCPSPVPSDGSMRIAMVIQRFRPHFSGQGEQLEALCYQLATSGHEVTILTSAYDLPSSIESNDRFKVVRLRSSIPLFEKTNLGKRVNGPVFAAQVFTYLTCNPTFDIVHVHASTDALYTAWLWARLENKPIIFEMTLLDADDAVTMLSKQHHFQIIRNFIFRRCDGYVSISPALSTAFRNAGLNANHLQLIPQGVDIDVFAPSERKTELKRDIGIPETGPIITFIGSLIHRKGFDVLRRAWLTISTMHPDAQLVLVGRDSFEDPEQTAFLNKQLELLSRMETSRIHRLGLRDDVHTLLQATDVFVFPSRQEGFGTVMIEAMACGLPCVVTELPGITDFIFGPDSECGVVVKQSDDQALADSVVSLLNNPERATVIGLAARVRVVNRFSIALIADQYVSFYRDLMVDFGGRPLV